MTCWDERRKRFRFQFTLDDEERSFTHSLSLPQWSSHPMRHLHPREESLSHSLNNISDLMWRLLSSVMKITRSESRLFINDMRVKRDSTQLLSNIQSRIMQRKREESGEEDVFVSIQEEGWNDDDDDAKKEKERFREKIEMNSTQKTSTSTSTPNDVYQKLLRRRNEMPVSFSLSLSCLSFIQTWDVVLRKRFTLLPKL